MRTAQEPAYQCRKCKGGINPEASTCPHCGYAADERKSAWGTILIGLFLTCTIVGAVIGLPLMWMGFVALIRCPKKPAEKAPTA